MLLFITMVFCMVMGLLIWTYKLAQKSHQYQTSIKTLNDELLRLKNDKNQLIKADIVFEKLTHDLKEQLLAVDDRVEQLENQRNNDGGYQQALKMLQMGANKDDIINTCNLSHAEAELLMNLFAYQSLSSSN